MKKLITRTFEATRCNLIGVAMKDGKPEMVTDTFTITEKVDAKTAQKIVDKQYKGIINHPYVQNIENISELIGINPDVFYANGIKLDTVTRKPIDGNNDEEVEVENTDEE